VELASVSGNRKNEVTVHQAVLIRLVLASVKIGLVAMH
jgi:hypothetical protein